MRILLIIIFVFSFVFLKIQGQTAPEIGSITQPTCSVPTGSVVLNGLPSGEWTLTRSPGNEITTGSGTTITVSDLPAGVSCTFTVTTSEGTSPASNPAVINPQPSPPPLPAAAVTEQPTCTVGTAAIVVISPSGPEFEYNIDNGSYQSSATFTGILPGDHEIRARSTSDNTCISFPAAVAVNPRPATPAAPTAGAITHPTCAEPAGSIVLSGLPSTGTWTLNMTPGGSIQGSGSGTTLSGLAPGSYSFTVTNEAGCTSTALSNVVINPGASVPDAATLSVVHPTCAAGTGSITVTAPSGDYQYSIDGGTFQASVLFTGISPGPHTILVRRSTDNTCISSPALVTVNPRPPAPPAPVLTLTHPTCETATGIIVITYPLGNYQYSIDDGSYQASAAFSGVVSGDHNVRVRSSVDNTCVSDPVQARINPQPVVPAPLLGTVTQPACAVATGSVLLNGLPPTGTWTLTRTPGESVTGTGTSITIAGLAANTYSFRVTNESGCTSAPLAGVVINSQPVTPAAPVAGTLTQPDCSHATGSAILNNLPPEGTWTLTRAPDGATISGTGATTTVSGLTANTYTFTVTNASGCTSTPSANVVITPQPETPSPPVIGTITHPDCSVSTGSVIAGGLPSAGTWTLTRNPGGVSTSSSGTSTTLYGIPPGNYTYVVSNAAGCISAASAGVVINASPVTPPAPVAVTIVQPGCSTETGSVTLNGLPSTGSWTLTRNPGNIRTTGTGPGITITRLMPDTYTFTVTNESGCTSPVSANVTINPQPLTPLPPAVGPITHPTCTSPGGSIVLNGLPPAGEWTITGSPGDISYSGSGASVTIPGLPTNTYRFTVTNESGCISVPSGYVTINPQPPTPAAPVAGTITHPTCTVATGTVVLGGLPSAGTWTMTGSPGGTTYTGTGSSFGVSGLPPGRYTFTVTNSYGCISNSGPYVVINPQPPTPSAPAILSITQPVESRPAGSVVIGGLPSSDTWILTRRPDGSTITGTGVSTTVSGLPPGIYTFTATNSHGCISPPSSAAGIYTLRAIGPGDRVMHQNDTIRIGNSEAGSLTIKIESNAEWTVSENSMWLKAEKEASPSVIKVTYLENISVLDKTGSLKIQYSLNPEVVLFITQKGRISRIKESKLESAAIYPNPANTMLNVDLPGEKSDRIIITITNKLGNVVLNKEYKGYDSGRKLELNISALPYGQYFVTVSDGEDHKTLTLIKQ